VTYSNDQMCEEGNSRESL
jgi:hypothetical protein